MAREKKNSRMSVEDKSVLQMAEWMAREYAKYSPAERGRKIRKALGDSASARSFVRRLLPQFYNDVYGDATSSEASDHSESAHAAPLHAKPR
jgi:hypothetical protein